MGQQQILLVVLGFIIVGIAITAGIYLFTSNAVSSNRDGVVSDIHNLGLMAQQYYKTPSVMGGGGKMFTGWTIPTKSDTTPNGTYTATVSDQSVIIVGTGKELNLGSPIVQTATIYPTTISMVKSN
jgi:hypothetical protein